MSRSVKIISVLVFLLALAGASWFVYQKWTTVHIAEIFPEKISTTSNETLPAIDTTPRTAPEGQLEYRGTKYRFSLFYPKELSYKEYDEGNGASTISFENADDSLGFQIFVVPYGKTQIDLARFRLDEPSGVMANPTSALIDAVQTVLFFGSNPIMGDTREVWFIRGGYLFEVTTYKDLDAWLSQIMSSWKFI